MRKYILSFAILLGGLMSCTNDDIAIENFSNTLIEINPQNVMSEFEPYYQEDNLDLIGNDAKLRLQLLIYDANGNLAYQEAAFSDNYTQSQRFSPKLPVGQYTAVAISDVLATNEYWKLEDVEKLSTLRMVDQGKIGGKEKSIGLSSLSLSIETGKKETIKMDLKTAGSLFIISYRNIHRFTDVKTYSLSLEPSAEWIKFDTDGSPKYEYSQANSGYVTLLHQLIVDDYPNSNAIYGYAFVLPGKQYNFNFEYNTGDGHVSIFDTPATANIERGKEYHVILDLNDKDGDISASIAPYNAQKAVSKVLTKTIAQHKAPNILYIEDYLK